MALSRSHHHDSSPRDVIRLREGTVEYDPINYAPWRVPLSEVRLLGEYTTPHGPYVEDHFLVLVTRGGERYYASLAADGAAEVIKSFEQQFRSPLEFRLQGSSDLDSRIIWPAKYAGESLFVFRPKPPKTLWQHVRKIAHVQSLEAELSDKAMEAIGSNRAKDGVATKKYAAFS